MLRRASLCLLAAPFLSVPADSQPGSQGAIFLTGRVIWPMTGRTAWLNAAPSDDLVNLRGEVPTATIGPAIVQTPYRVLYVSPSANVGRIGIDGVKARVIDGCVRAHANVVIVRNTRCTMQGGPQSGGVNMPFGLNITSAREVAVEDSSFDGFQWTAPANRYWNGDGITIEKDVAAARFERVSANHNSDAGFDVRPFAVMNDVSAADNCRNFRFWAGGNVGTLTTGDAVKRGGISACSGIWLNGSRGAERPKLHIRKLVVRMRRPGLIFEIETGPADIEVDACDIVAPAGTQLVRFEEGAGEVRLGNGCRLQS